MKKWCALLCFFSSLSFAGVDEISIEAFFKNPQYQQITISPNGKYLAFTYSEGKEIKVAVLDRESKKMTTSFGFGEYTKVTTVRWATDERVLVEYVSSVGFLDDRQSMPTLVAFDYDGDKRSLLIQGQTNMGEEIVFVYRILNVLKNDPSKILIARWHGGDKGKVKAYTLNIENGKLDYIGEEPPRVNTILSDRDGVIRIGASYKETDDDEFGKGELSLVVRNSKTDGWRELNVEGYEKGDKINFIGFSDDQNYVYYTSSIGPGVEDLYRFNFSNDSIEHVFSSDIVEIGSPINWIDGIVGFTYMPDKLRFELFEETKGGQLVKQLQDVFQGSIVMPTSRTSDGKTIVLRVFSDKSRGDYYLFDAEKMDVAYLASIDPQLEPEKMATMQPITVTARDGLTLHGYLTLPVDSKENNPMIVLPHGGPHGPRDRWGFDPEVQFFANRGYAVLQINFRGSGGYGKEFEEAGYRKWGREMQDDVTDATLWAVEQGYADKDRICIYGGSYGGYAALMGAVREPDLYQCTVGYVGVFSLPLMYKDGDISSRKSGRKYLERVLGEDEATLKKYSAAYNVDKIKADIMLVHGKKDVRVPYSQYEALAEALEKAGIGYESLVEEDEGHGFVQYEAKVNLYKKLEAFFDKHIGKP